jgi:transglutaminase-like putative cysteine protease
MRAALAQLVLAGFAAACGLAFAPAFGARLVPGDLAPAALLVAVVVGALAPVGTVVVARRLGADALLAAAAGLVVAAVAIVVTTRPGTAVFSGGYRLLTSALPAPADGPACATIAALTAVPALIAALLVGYSRRHALAVVPAFGCLVAALALDAGVGAPPPGYAAVLLVLLGAALVLIRPPVRDIGPAAPSVSARLVRVGLPLAGVAAILAVGAGLAVALPADLPGVDSRSADARNLVAAPLRPRSAVNPMQQYPALAQGVDTVALHGTSSRRLDELPYVTLSEFTGQTWTAAAQFRRASRTLRLQAASPSVTVHFAVSNARALSWLVRPDQPVGVDRGGLGYDAATNDIVVPRGVAYPKRYRVTGGMPVHPSAALGSDRVVRRNGPVSTGTVGVPPTVSAFAVRSRAASSDYQQLVALQALLRGDEFYVDDTSNAPSGSGYYQIQRLLAQSTKHIGTSEQYASAFAVMARVLGYDSRVVLGFRPRYARHGAAFVITGRDIHAWPQVRFAHAGWVTFDPTPAQRASKSTARRKPAGSTSTPTNAPQSTAAPHGRPALPGPRGTGPQSASSTNAGLLVAVAGGAIVALGATPPVFKATRRRRRRGAARPARAVYGAWQEATDRLRELGVARGAAFTSETAARSPVSVRAEIRALGRLVDKAGYAPEDAPPADARSAWAHADATTRILRIGMPIWRRLLAALDPRPLRRG